MNNLLELLFLFFILIITSCSITKKYSVNNKNLVKSYIDARNNYDVKKINTLIEENYSETFIDGTVEVENKEQLYDQIIWGKELDSNIKLLDIQTNEKSVTTIEENTNYLDVALKRKSRKFRIIYTFENNKILSQKIDTLNGYNQILKFNSERDNKFSKYCEQNNLILNNNSLNQEFGIQLRKVLEQYKIDNE